MTGHTIGRYTIFEQLGGGGMGVVYKARDNDLDRLVAIKFIRSDASNSEAVSRFFGEAKAASALNHPNIITVHELNRFGDNHYLVTELVDGQTLRKFIGAQPIVEPVLRIAMQIAEALSVAHSAGIIHRDIKPENVMVRKDGYVKLLDFGLARPAVATRLAESDETLQATMPGMVVGTLNYLSPEQIQGMTATGASDVFAFGVMLYELLTGKHPFRALTPLATLQAITHEDPARLTDLAPSLSEQVEDLVLSMLARDPARRPSALSVQQTLQSMLDISSSPVLSQQMPVQLIRKTVGRGQELESLRSAFHQAMSRKGSVVFVTGEPGMGKTTLVEDFLRSVPEAILARGRCSERLGGTEAYLPVLEAMSVLARTDHGRRVMQGAAPTWYAEARATHEDSIATREALAAAGATSQDRMKREVLTFIEEFTTARPLVLFFDDIHWADVSTVDLVGYIGNHCADLPLLLIMTYRVSDMMLAKHPFRPVVLELQSKNLARELTLNLLTRDSLLEYLDLEFPGNRFPESFVDLIYQKTEGNPLFMGDVLRDLRQRGVVLAREGGAYELSQTVLAIEKELPGSVRSMIQRKTERLSEDDRKLLTAAAVQGAEFDSAVLARVLSLEPEDVEESLAALEHTHALVRVLREQEMPDGSLNLRYRFVHVLYQNSLYDQLGPARRARLSLAIAGSLSAFYGRRASEIAADLALLYEAGRDFWTASGHYLAAAKNAIRVVASQQVIILGERGLACLDRAAESPERDERELAIRLILGSAWMATRGFGGDELLETYRRAGELCRRSGVGAQQLAAVRGMWAFHLVRGEFSEALDLSRQLGALADSTGDPAARVEAHLAFGFTYGHMGRTLESAETLRKGVAVADPRSFPDRALAFALDAGVACRGQLATQLWYLGYPDDALSEAKEALLASERLGSPYCIGWSKMFVAIIHEMRGEVDENLRISSDSLQFAVEHGMREVQGWALTHHGWSLVHKGRAEEGLGELRYYLMAQREMGSRIALPNSLAQLAECLLLTGGYAEARQRLEEALQIGASNGELYYEAEIHRLLGEVLRAENDDAPAERIDQEFRIALRIAAERQTRSWHLRAATSLARFLQSEQGGNRVAEARAILEPSYSWFTQGFETRDLREAAALLQVLESRA